MGAFDGIRITVTSFCARNSGAEIEVSLVIEGTGGEEKKKLLLLSRYFSELGLKKGELSPDDYDELVFAAQTSSAVKRGMLILGYGANSKRNLALKLRSKGFEAQVAERAAEYLLDAGFIDECADAEREAERCLAKLWGRKRIYAALKAKGFSDDAVRSAMELLEDVDFHELCRKAIRKKYSSAVRTPEGKQKAFSALARLGFSSDEIRSALVIDDE